MEMGMRMRMRMRMEMEMEMEMAFTSNVRRIFAFAGQVPVLRTYGPGFPWAMAHTGRNPPSNPRALIHSSVRRALRLHGRRAVHVDECILVST
jgi:hypothetical protein